MSVAEITPIERYTGDGKQTEFPVGWRFNHPSHLKLVSSTARLLVLGRDYQVVDQQVVFNEPPAAGEIIAILRDTPKERSGDYDETGSIPGSSLNFNYDAAILMIQELAEELSRCVKGSATNPNASDEDYYIKRFVELFEEIKKVREELQGMREEIMQDLEDGAENIGAMINSSLTRIDNLLAAIGDLEDLVERVENLDVDCLMPPVSKITPENSGNPVIANYPMGSMDSAHRVVLEFNDANNLFYNNGPALVYGGTGGNFIDLGWARSPGCLKITQESEAIEFKIDESSFGSMNRSNSVNAEDYLTVSFRCRFNEVLPEGRRRSLLELWSENCVDYWSRDLYGRLVLTMAWISPGLLQFEMWNNNDAPGVIWANARLSGLFDGAWHLIEWRIRPGDRFTSTSLPGQALWLDGTFIDPTYYSYPTWRISSYGDLRIGLGRGYHPKAAEAETNTFSGRVQTATFEQWCPGRFDEFTISTIRRHENNENYEPSSGPLVGGGAGYVISSQPLGAFPVKVTGASDTAKLTCEVTNLTLASDSIGSWNLNGNPYFAAYHLRTAEPANVFALFRPFCVLGFGSEDCTKLAWQEVTPTVSFDVYSLLYNKGADVDRSYEICGGSVWSHTKGQTGYRWNTRWNVGISSSSYYYGLKENWGHPPLRVECLLPDEVIHSGFITGEMRHGASYGKHLRGWRFGGQEFIFIPQLLVGSRRAKDSGGASGIRIMVSLWFRPAVDGPTEQQTLLYERNMGGQFSIQQIGSTIRITVCGNYGIGDAAFLSVDLNAVNTLFDGTYHHVLFMADHDLARYRAALDGVVSMGNIEHNGSLPAIAALNEEYIYWDTYSYSGMIHRYTCIGAMPKDGHWGQDTGNQQNYPMEQFYQGDLDEFVSWADPEIKTDQEFSQVAEWLWNGGNGLFFPGNSGALTQSYVPAVGDMGVVMGGVFLPTGTTLANAIAKIGSSGESDDPNQFTDDPVSSPIDDDPYNTSHGTAVIDAWTGDIRFICHRESSPLNYKCEHPVLKNNPAGAPTIEKETYIHNFLVSDLMLLYTEGVDHSRVWCGTGSITHTETKYDAESGTFVQTTTEKKVVDAVLSWNIEEMTWQLVLTQTEPDVLEVPVSIEEVTGGDGEVVDYNVTYTEQTCTGKMVLTSELPVSDRWTGIHWASPDAQEPDSITGDFTTFIVEKQ